MVITQMLGRLETQVPPNRARLLSARERPVGLANWRGVEVFGSQVPVALKGGRLEAGVLFEVSRADADLAETAARELNGNVQVARDLLRGQGFLRIDGPDFSLPELDETDSSFRKTVSYRILYEYQYRDVDGSRSFITRIPARLDPDEPDSPDRENVLITGRVVRWQREEADQEIPPPPTLLVRGPTAVPALSVAALLPDTPAAEVVLLRTFDGAAGPPAVAATLADLTTAAHIRRSYASLADFLAEFPPPTDSVELVDLADVAGAYVLRRITFGPALALPRPIDRLEISTSAAGWVGSNAVLYLHAEGG